MTLLFIKRINRFFRTTAIGGLAALLPLGLVFLILRWIITLITRYLGPLVGLIKTDSRIQVILLYLILVALILSVFFFVGLVVQTRMGKFFNRIFEEKYLMKIPGYKIAKETVQQFFGKNRSFFSEVVLVDVFNSGTLMTGFLTDDHGNFLTVFVPTGPNPTSGNIFHVAKNKVIRTSALVETGMKSIISCGAGSSEIFKNAGFEESRVE